MQYGYIGSFELPSYLSIEIKDVGESRKVFIHSKIHMEKVKELSFSYSNEFTDEDILKDPDLYKKIASMYGLKIVTRLE